MTAVYPEGTPTLGNTRLTALADIPDDLTSITVAEANAGLGITCYVYPAGWNPTGTTAKGTKPARLCSKVTLEQLNRTTYTLADLQYVYDPQALISAIGNEAYELLVEGAEIVFLEGRGLDGEEEDWDAGDHYRAHHVRLGAQIPSGDNTDENGEFFIMQSIVYANGGPVDGVIDAS